MYFCLFGAVSVNKKSNAIGLFCGNTVLAMRCLQRLNNLESYGHAMYPIMRLFAVSAHVMAA